jgi:hypothetical protein
VDVEKTVEVYESVDVVENEGSVELVVVIVTVRVIFIDSV